MRQPGSAQAPVYPCLEVTAATCAARASTRGARARTARAATAVRRAADTAPAATERRCASWRLATTGVIAAQRAGARWVARCGAATRLREPTSTAAIFETRDTLGERHAVADRPVFVRYSGRSASPSEPLTGTRAAAPGGGLVRHARPAGSCGRNALRQHAACCPPRRRTTGAPAAAELGAST